jgi:D-glycero-alpha-D-manno-heptose-7-phosphate kinase
MASRSDTLNQGIVMTRTPLRISFAGGGTDLPDFYEREHGAVYSTAINKYVYVTVKRHSDLFFEPIRVNYSKTEQVHSIDEIENNIARECLRLMEIEPPIYISTVADMPASSGLGGSSSFAVGLLHALHAYRGERVSASQLAEEACHIEIDVLKQPIGKQDQYAAAFGGLNLFSFNPNGNVTVEPQRVSHDKVSELFRSFMLFWTGMQRDTETVLAEQKRNTPAKFATLREMRDHAHCLQSIACNGSIALEAFGRVLDDSWQLKRQLASTITNDQINAWYERAMAAGAEGGKLCGAGGGGFLLIIARPERQAAIRRALADLPEITVRYEVHGSTLLAPSMY